ncbi:unnamed protein product [Bursaphelenchus xylophilus]|uniref:(pine wood nematode) hypothetical protein n=1 Tax=Bursaphelenchus xylophilus TaxID=6326 RepID=A0A1I7RJL3_BURXY|nr:unnamed protein product [Bursaphelenchus xylophilus]CAG9128939.1 unnamed protein product [Bursaphelenchus xylophilus]
MPAKSQVYIVNEDAASKDAIIADDTPKTPWKSIYFIGVLALCTAIQFSLYFSSMWPYLQLLDHTVTEEFYGYVVAVYSAGLIIAAPLIGLWSNRVKNIRTPVRFCICLQLSGNLLYFFAQLLPFGRKFAVMFARFFVGAACCHSGLLKAYAATASVAADRSRAMAIFTGGVAFGLTVGPGLQLIFVPLGFPGFKLFDILQINMYTTPPLAAMFLNSTALFIMTFLFEETYAGLATSTSHAVKDKEGDKEEKEQRRAAKEFKIPPFDKLALVLCHLGRFTQTFTFTALETIGTAYAMTIFAWTKKEAVTYVAISYSFMSVVEFLAYALFVFAKLDRWLRLRFHCLCGFAALIVLHLITFSWPFLPGELTTYTNKDMDRHLNQSAPEPVGCNLDRLSWCTYTKPVNVWVYNISFVLIVGVSYCVINITLETLFSKVLGPRRQAAHQGFLEMTEGAARFSGPVLISSLYTAFGPRAAWVAEIVVLSTAVSLWLIFYKRLVPLKMPTSSDDKESTDGSLDDEEEHLMAEKDPDVASVLGYVGLHRAGSVSLGKRVFDRASVRSSMRSNLRKSMRDVPIKE